MFRFQPVLTLRFLVAFTAGEASSLTQMEGRRTGGAKTELRCHQRPSAASRSRRRRHALVIDYGPTGRLRLGCRFRGARTECRSVTPHGVEKCRPGHGPTRWIAGSSSEPSVPSAMWARASDQSTAPRTVSFLASVAIGRGAPSTMVTVCRAPSSTSPIHSPIAAVPSTVSEATPRDALCGLLTLIA